MLRHSRQPITFRLQHDQNLLPKLVRNRSNKELLWLQAKQKTKTLIAINRKRADIIDFVKSLLFKISVGNAKVDRGKGNY